MTRQPSTAGRLAWIDQLRTLAIVLVVNMHACVTYSHVGSWYVMEPPAPPMLTKLLFVFWQGHLQAFFMGILFLAAGYFAHGSLVRHGPGGFIRERLMRLGAPTLFYMLVLNPIILLVINPNGNDYGPLAGAYAGYIATGRFLGGTGPMWFAAALLVFSAVLAEWRALRPQPATAASPAAPGGAAVATWGLALVAATFVTRTVEPIDSSVLNMQLCYFPQYVLAFATGVAAARGRWLQALARSALARRAGWAAVILGPVALALVLVRMGILKGTISRDFAGGWNPTALAFASWEQLTGLGLGLGALAFCSGKLDVSTPLSRWLSERSFGVYLFHPPILILITIAMRPIVADPFFKVALLTAGCLIASYLVSDVVRRIPGLRALV